jgi:hypothetical protein
MVPGVSYLGKLDSCHKLSISCFRCDAPPEKLDDHEARRRSHEITDFLIKNFDRRILWDEYGIRTDVVVRTSIMYLSDDAESDICPISHSHMDFLAQIFTN